MTNSTPPFVQKLILEAELLSSLAPHPPVFAAKRSGYEVPGDTAVRHPNHEPIEAKVRDLIKNLRGLADQLESLL